MPQPTPEPIDILEALHSTPARRFLSSEPIADEVIWALLDAAIRGPSGGNNQGWGWVVVTDRAVKERIAEYYREGWYAAYGNRRPEADANAEDGGLSPRSYDSAAHLAEHLQDAPVWIFPVLRNAATSRSRLTGSSIYGAVQQLMLAARAYGIGSTLTTLHSGHENEVRELLGLPDDAATMALIPLGYPAKGRWSEPKRRAVADVTYWERWGVTRTPEQPGA